MPKLFSNLDRTTILRALLIIAVGLWIYSPVYQGGWLWDDDKDIYKNPLVLKQAGWWMNWLEPSRQVAYYPITADIQWLQWRLWGDDTLGYHLTNIVLHLCSALLIWRLLGMLGLRLAWLGGLLFVVHPVTIESVAWIAELKNTLSLPPFLLALCYWIDYEDRRRPGDYRWTLIWFLIAILCKVSTALFPATMLLYVWWKRGRLGWSDLKASLPFWIIVLELGLISLRLHQVNTLTDHRDSLHGLLPRLACLGTACLFFLFKAVWPVGMLPIYPAWKFNPLSFQDILPGLILIALLAWFWTRRKGWGRHALLGIGFFLINLIPVLVAIQLLYAASMIWSLDHLNYLPLIGSIGLMVAGLEEVSQRLSPAPSYVGGKLVAMAIIIMALGSHLYATAFVNSETLWSYTMQRNPDAWPAHANLGALLQIHGLHSEALKEFSAALKINPESYEAEDGMGNALVDSGRAKEAIPYYEAALKHYPGLATAYNNLANALIQTGDLAGARTRCEQALNINPHYAEAHATLALALARMGHLPEALEQFQIAHRLEPSSVQMQSGIEWIEQLQEEAAEKK